MLLTFLFGVAASTDAITPQEHAMISSSFGTIDDLQDGHRYILYNDSWCNATTFILLTVALKDAKASFDTFIIISSLSKRSNAEHVVVFNKNIFNLINTALVRDWS